MESLQIGSQLVKLRKSNGWSQEELASKLSVTRQAISNWERGVTQPDLEMLMKIAEIFNTDLNGLIDGVSKPNEEKIELNLKALKWIYLTHLFSIIGYFGWIIVSPTHQFSSMMGMLITFLFMSTIIYFVFTHGIKTGDYALVAGYDKRIKYHESNLKKMIYMMEFYCLFTILTYTCIYIGLNLLNVDASWLMILLLVLFIVQFIGGILYLNIKYRQDILLDASEQEEARVGMKVTICFMISIITMVIATIFTQVIFNISNNTVEAGKLVLFILPYVFLNIVGLFLEENRVKKAVKENRPYRLNSMTYFIIIASLILLIGMIYTGYQTTLI